MSEVAANPGAAAPAAAEAAPAAEGAPVEGTAAAAAAEPAKVDAPAPDEGAKALSKALAGERRAVALVAKLQADLTAATGSATEAQQKAAVLEDIKRNPRKLLELGVTWDQVLDAMSEPDKPEDPATKKLREDLAAQQARLDARDKADADAKAAKEAAAQEKAVADSRANVQAVIAAEGDVADKDGYPRWAIVSQDPKAVDEVIEAVVKEIDTNRMQITPVQAMDMVRQGLDQLEAFERKKASKYKAANVAVRGNGEKDQPTVATTKLRPALAPDRFTIDDSTRDAPAPKDAAAKESARPRTRPAEWSRN